MKLFLRFSLWRSSPTSPASIVSNVPPSSTDCRPEVNTVRLAGSQNPVHHHHQSLNREGRLGTTNDFCNQFSPFFPVLHCPLGLTVFQACPYLDVVFHLFLCLPCLLPLSLCLARWFWLDLMNGKHDHTTAVCVSLRSSGDLHVVQLPAGSWHGLPRW